MGTQLTATASSIGLVVAGALAAATTAVADAAQSTCTPHITNWTSFEIPGVTEPGTGAQPVAINDYGEVAGTYRTSNQSSMQSLGFLRYPNGTIVTFDVPNSGGRTYVSGMNVQGQIIGEYVDGLLTRGFIRWAHGAFTSVDDPAPSQTDTSLNGINDWAVAVGSGSQGGFVRHADGSITNIAGSTGLLTINDQGVALGWTSTGYLLLKPDGTRVIWTAPQGTRDVQLRGLDIEGSVIFDANYLAFSGHSNVGFIRHPSGTFTWIFPSTPTYDEITLKSINNRGNVVGYEDNSSSGARQGFAQIWYGPRVLVNAPAAGRQGAIPTAINNYNVMTGSWIDNSSGLSHGFVATLDTCD